MDKQDIKTLLREGVSNNNEFSEWVKRNPNNIEFIETTDDINGVTQMYNKYSYLLRHTANTSSDSVYGYIGKIHPRDEYQVIVIQLGNKTYKGEII